MYNYHTTAPPKQAAENTIPLFIYLHITFLYIFQLRPFPYLFWILMDTIQLLF